MFRLTSFAKLQQFQRGEIAILDVLLRPPFARMAELVDAHDSNSCSARSVGSIPTSGTKPHKRLFLLKLSQAFLQSFNFETH